MRMIMIVALALVCLSALGQDLETVQKAIIEQDAGWEAAENAISILPDEVLKRIMGVHLPALDVGEYPIGEISTNVPAEWDWRSINDLNWVTPVKDQGQCGSCWAFGTVTQLESGIMIVNRGIDPLLDLSEQYMVSCDKANSGCNGGYMDRAYNFLVSSGIPAESCFVYKARDLPCSDACADPVLTTIEDWHSVRQTIDALQEAVYLQPITVAFYVYRDFMYYKAGVYKHVTGDLLGGHAVCIIGWSQKDECFIVKNSWGVDWGEDGYFRIAFSQVDYPVRFGIEAGKFDLPPAAVKSITLKALWGKLKNGDSYIGDGDIK